MEDDDGEDLDIRAQLRGSSSGSAVSKTTLLAPGRESVVSSEAGVSRSSSSASSSATASSTLGSISSLNANLLNTAGSPVVPEGERSIDLHVFVRVVTTIHNLTVPFWGCVLALDCMDFNFLYLKYYKLTSITVCNTILFKYIYIIHKPCITPSVLQRHLFLILDVASYWTRAPVETIAFAGTMTSRPMPVHSFGMEAAVEMTTAMKQKMNARRLVFNSEVSFVDYSYITYNHIILLLMDFSSLFSLISWIKGVKVWRK